MNRLTFSASLTAVLFILGMALQAGAEQGKSTQVTRSNISNNKVAGNEQPDCAGTVEGGDCDDAAAVKSPRDAASGQATGKRQHKPVTITKELDKSSPATADADGDGAGDAAVASEGCCPGRCCPPGADEHAINTKGTGSSGKTAPPRDAASGQATGKRQHTPVRVSTGDVNGDGSADAAAATEVNTARDAGSGMATGKSAAATDDHNSSRSNKTASTAASDEYCCPGRCCPPGASEATTEAQPQTYKAKAGKTGSAK